MMTYAAQTTIWKQTNIHQRGNTPTNITQEIKLDLEELHTAWIYGWHAIQTP